MKTQFLSTLLNPPKSWFQSLLHLAFPHICEGCGSDVITLEHSLCLSCLNQLPRTHFEQYVNNPMEKIFWGRLPVTAATALYYFTKEATLQHLLHQFKYRNQKRLGHYLGQQLGIALAHSERFQDVTALVPIPLFSERERKRGYNQSVVLCEGIQEVWNRTILKDAVVRVQATESQTRKNRIERWQNMEDRFQVNNPAALANQHILLIDDVITTGATLEACGQTILMGHQTRLSIATLCISSS